MASSINFNSIDENYPVAGIDNDSQGFRDNFTFIKNSLEAAKSEIETLQNTTAKVNAESNFNGNNIIEANLINTTEEIFEAEINPTGINEINVDTVRGGYQKYTINSTSVLCFLNDWPTSDSYSKVRLQFVKGTDATGNVTITFSAGAGTIYYGNFEVPRSIVLDDLFPRYVDAWTDNRGQSVYLHDLGKFAT